MYYIQIFIVIYSSLHGFIKNQHNDQLPISLLAELVDHYTGIRGVMGSNPVQAWIFSTLYFHYSLSGVHYCDDLSHSRLLIRSSNIWYSYIHSRSLKGLLIHFSIPTNGLLHAPLFVNSKVIIESLSSIIFCPLLQSFKGSFLKHSKTTLSRLSSITSNTPNASATTRGFVFHTVSPSGKNDSNAKVCDVPIEFTNIDAT